MPNGLKIVHRTTPSEVAYIGIMIGAGTRDEVSELNGLAHYVEHTVFKGAGKRTARQIINSIEGIGGEINAYTTKEETTFYAATPILHYKQTLQLLFEMVTQPTFPKKETDKEVGVILDEIESYEDSPAELIYDDFESLIFEGHPLAMPILGTKKTLRKMSSKADFAQQWIKTHFTLERMVVFSQGRIDFQKVVRFVERLFADTACLPIQDERTRPCDIVQQSKTLIKRTHQAHALVGGRAYEIGHPKQLAMYMLNNILGGGSLNSRLNLSLREQKGLVYTIESQFVPLSDTGYWGIYFATEPQQREQCLQLIYKELKRLREETMTSLQFQRALTQLHGQMAISAENQENNALAMGKLMLYQGIAPTWEETFEEITKLTPIDLQDVANELLTENNLSTLFYV
ncbi:MAG: insulinase family protein [Paludibacteraceae bacterium]|nr:insulinase family protein [Paludibacteraceae bacterium]